MVDHPLISTELRQYIQKHKIEELLNQGLNLVMAQLPMDPYSTMATTLIESQQKPPLIESLHASETFLGLLPTIQIDVHAKFLNRAIKATSYVFTYSQEDAESPEFIFDSAETKQGTTGVCSLINTKLSDFLKGKELPLSNSTISMLASWFQRLKQKETTCSPYAVRAVIEALYSSYGKIIDPEAPAIAMFEQQQFKKIPEDGNPQNPKLMFTLFNGGKALGSKVKFAKFYLILSYSLQDLNAGKEALLIYYKIATAIKKSILATKLGENGFKPTASGSWFNAHDNHNETFKLIEEAINQSGANQLSQVLSIGLQVDPDLYFDANQSKYDIEGPKNMFDVKQLVEWYFKVIQEHPLVTYIEDGVRSGDVAGWQTLVSMMAAKCPQVRIGVNKWFKSDLNLIKQFTQLTPKAEEDEEQETSEATEDPNVNKFVPHLVHISKSQLFSANEPQRSHTGITEMVSYCFGLKGDEKVGIILDDQTFESSSAEIVDFAFAHQIDCVNLQGINRPERASKVERLQEITEQVLALQPAPESQDTHDDEV